MCAAHEAADRLCGLTEHEMELITEGALSELSGQQRGLLELTPLVGYHGLLALQLRVCASEEAR
ncbi:hypothetical protein [Streptomyces plumbiresistens]|uniref:Uncharacterized protein n=1 Tax=Streptomyces plumbiresistens TaxID=511811 RepID=A0ABP7SMD1_9ACTN